MSHFRYVQIAAFILIILNIFDGVFTYYIVSHGLGIEINPLHNYLLDKGAWAFFSVKLGVANLVFLYLSYLLIRYKERANWSLGSSVIITLPLMLYVFIVCNQIAILAA